MFLKEVANWLLDVIKNFRFQVTKHLSDFKKIGNMTGHTYASISLAIL